MHDQTPPTASTDRRHADYDRLGAFDRVFLDLEDANAHMHIGALMVFDDAGLVGSNGGVDIERIRRFIRGRLDAAQRYRQKLAYIPIEDHPVWIDDHRFDLGYHIRHTSLPKPGDAQQLEETVARIVSQPLDRSRPLWEMWIIEGLQEGRFAILQKIHHCMVDGIGGTEEMAHILSAHADEILRIPAPWRPRPNPIGAALLRDAILRRAATPLLAARTVLRTLRRDPRRTLDGWTQTLEGLASIVTRAVPPASDTRLNRPIGAQRRFSWVQTELAEFKRIKDALGGTVNDVVLTLVAGALRRFFLDHGDSPAELERMTVRAMCPVNRRAADGPATAGNKIAGMFVELPVGVADPVDRLREVCAETLHAKSAHQAEAVEAVAMLSEWTTPALMQAIGRTGSRNRTYNLVVTNIPGPQFPLYLLGAKLREAYPVVPIFEHQGLTIALLSYDGKVCWGLNADREIVPDLHRFATHLRRSLEELSDAAAARTPQRRATSAPSHPEAA